MRKVFGFVIALAGLGLAVGAVAIPAAAQSSGSVQANVSVNQVLELTGLPASFQLAGDPGQTVTAQDAVTFTVTTNNANGASTILQSVNLVGPGGAVIPATSLSYSNPQSNGGTYTALVAAPGTQNVAGSGLGITPHSLSFQIQIPAVNPGNYTGTLNFSLVAS